VLTTMHDGITRNFTITLGKMPSPPSGTAIFYHDKKQKEIAEKLKSDVEKAGRRNYYESHRDAPYCNFVIAPKVHKLIAKYGNDLKTDLSSSAIK
jgi:peptide methionine sulfoxide reductase MsrA